MRISLSEPAFWQRSVHVLPALVEVIGRKYLQSVLHGGQPLGVRLWHGRE